MYQSSDSVSFLELHSACFILVKETPMSSLCLRKQEAALGQSLVKIDKRMLSQTQHLILPQDSTLQAMIPDKQSHAPCLLLNFAH